MSCIAWSKKKKEARPPVLALSFPTAASDGHQRHTEEETRQSQDPSLRRTGEDTPTKKTHTHTHKTSPLPAGKSSLLAAVRRFILTLLGWVVGVRLVVCGGWGRGRLLVAPVANWRESTGPLRVWQRAESANPTGSLSCSSTGYWS